MSFEDDMIEYGFNDANDYMNYLMDEADRVDKELEKFNFDEDDSRNLLRNKREQARLEKEKEEELFQVAINNDIILKQWMINDPNKAKRWYAYYEHSPKLNNNFDDFINNLGKPESILKVYHSISQYIYHSNERFENWKCWLEKYDKYENFKVNHFDKWISLKTKIEAKYIKENVDSFFYCYENSSDYFKGNNIDERYKTLTKWINENTENWSLIEEKYFSHLRSDEEYLFQSWSEKFHWFDKSAILKYKNPLLWEKHKKDFTENEKKGKFEISEKKYKELWIMYNQSTWEKWLCKYSVLWNDYVSEHNVAHNNLNEIFGVIDNYDSNGEYYANNNLMNLWIQKYPSKWRKWKIEYLWLKRCSEFYYEDTEYFEVWKLLYPQKWEKWKNGAYKEWKYMAIRIDLFISWILDENEIIFDKWASKNIANWEEAKESTMLSDITNAYMNMFNSRIYVHEVQEWKKNNPDEWSYWKELLKEEILVLRMNR